MLAAVDVQPFAPVCLGVFWLVRRARDRLEGGRPLTGTVTLPAVSLEQRRAAERLTGRSACSRSSPRTGRRVGRLGSHGRPSHRRGNSPLTAFSTVCAFKCW